MPCDFPFAVDFGVLYSIKFSYKFKVNNGIEFNKAIIPLALVAYQIGFSQLDPSGFVRYLPSHIQRALMEKNVKYVWVIDQVLGQDGWILAKFFFCEFMDRDEVEVHKLAKKKNEANIQPS